MEDYSFANEKTYEAIKERLVKMTNSKSWSIKRCLACIYDLYENYAINDIQEAELYKIADPKDLWNEPSVYWNNYNGKNPLLDVYRQFKTA